MLRLLVGMSLALLLTTGGILAFFRIDRVGIAPGALEGGTRQVCAPRDGIVAEVKVAPGGRVEAGQELVEVDRRDLVSSAAALFAEIEALRADRGARLGEVARLRREVHPRELQEARSAEARARLKLDQAEAAAAAMAVLGREGLAGKLQVDQAETDRKLAALALQESERAVPLLEARQRARIEALEAEVQRLEGDIESRRLERERTLKAIEESTVRAPVAGVVTASGLRELPGRAVKAGDELLRIAGATPDRFRGSLDDTGRAVVRPDQPAKIRLEGYPWLLHGTLRGRVARVSDRREEGGGFAVEIEVDPATAPGPLREGMRGVARIIVEERVSLGRLFLEEATGRLGP
jgi:multidrug resistance efflux pump